MAKKKVEAKQRVLSSMAGGSLSSGFVVPAGASPSQVAALRAQHQALLARRDAAFRAWIAAQPGTRGMPIMGTWEGGFRYRRPDGRVMQQAVDPTDAGGWEAYGEPVEVPEDPATQELRALVGAEVVRAFEDPEGVKVVAVAGDHFDFVLKGKTYRQAITQSAGKVEFQDFPVEVA